MTRDEFDNVLKTGTDAAVLQAICLYLPEEYDDLGRSAGDLVDFVSYANGELCNGGFHQFYSNGIFDPHRLVNDLRAIGEDELAKLVQSSIERFPEGVPPVRTTDDVEPIDGRLDEMGVERDTFRDLEDRYYQLCERLLSALAAWVRTHPDRYWAYINTG